MANDIVKALKTRERELARELKQIGKALASFTGGVKRKVTRRKRKALGTGIAEAAPAPEPEAPSLAKQRSVDKKKMKDEKAAKKARAEELKRQRIAKAEGLGQPV